MLIGRLVVLLAMANGAPVYWPKSDGKPVRGPARWRGAVHGWASAVRHLQDDSRHRAFGSDDVARRAARRIGLEARRHDRDRRHGRRLFSSFVKRRLGLPPSSMAIGLDQIAEETEKWAKVIRAAKIKAE
jgi:hypothetical protein